MSEHDSLITFIQNTLAPHGVLINQDTLLFKQKILDSMNILGLIGYVEKKLARRLTDDEIMMQNFESVNKIVEVFLHE